MAIRLFGERQFGVLGFAQDPMRNRLGRFTLGNLQGGGGSTLIFFSAACCGGILGIRSTGGFKNRFIRLGHG